MVSKSNDSEQEDFNKQESNVNINVTYDLPK